MHVAGETARFATRRGDEFASTQVAGDHGMLSARQTDWNATERGTDMSRTQSEVAVNARLLKIGVEVFPVYGDEKTGWSLDPGDLYPRGPIWFRYQSIDELFFALVNLNISSEGRA
jgi:hypothetical protein